MSEPLKAKAQRCCHKCNLVNVLLENEGGEGLTIDNGDFGIQLEVGETMDAYVTVSRERRAPALTPEEAAFFEACKAHFRVMDCGEREDLGLASPNYAAAMRAYRSMVEAVQKEERTP